MTPKLKAIGLTAVLAALAMTALAATGAFAGEEEEEEEGAPGTYTAAEYPATLDGTDATAAGKTNAFTFFGEKIECPDSSYSSSIPNAIDEITITPTYNNAQCSAAGGANKVTVTTNGCDYKVHTAGTTKTIYDNYYATAEILCPPGKDIEIHKYADKTEAVQICKYTIKEQKGIAGPKLQNEHVKEGTTGTLILEREFRALVVTKSGTCKDGEDKAGKIDLYVTFKGTNGSGKEDPIWVSD